MLPYQKLLYPCPFCGKETLEVIYISNYKAIRGIRALRLKSKTTWRKIPESIILLSEKCSNCGKTAKEIEKMERRIVNYY